MMSLQLGGERRILLSCLMGGLLNDMTLCQKSAFQTAAKHPCALGGEAPLEMIGASCSGQVDTGQAGKQRSQNGRGESIFEREQKMKYRHTILLRIF